jgi:hypothetical protein
MIADFSSKIKHGMLWDTQHMGFTNEMTKVFFYPSRQPHVRVAATAPNKKEGKWKEKKKP